MAYPVGIGSFDSASFIYNKEQIIEFVDKTHELDDPDDPKSIEWREKIIHTLYNNLPHGLKQDTALDDEVAMGAASVLMNMICAHGKCHFYEYGRGYLDFLDELASVAPEFHNFIQYIERPMFGLAGAIMDAQIFIGYIESNEAKVLLKAFDDNIDKMKDVCAEWDQDEEMMWSSALRDALVEAVNGRTAVLWYG